MTRRRAAAASLALGTALAAVAFGAAGGTELGRNALVEVCLLVAAGLGLALATLHRLPARPHGAVTVALFALFAGLTALSAAWSIEPAASVEAGARALAHLGVFAAAVAAGNLLPRSAAKVLGGVLLAGVAVAGWSILTRVLPGTLAEDELGGRLGAPFGYWNALGGMAAMCLPAALWLGARRGGGALVTALAYPAVAVLTLTILLTQSRGALASAVIAALLWLAVVPLRLRSLPVLALPALGVAPVAAWALSKPAFTESLQPLAAREAIAAELGLAVLALCAALLAAGLAVERAGLTRAPSLRLRRRTGLALVAVACALPLAGLTSVAVSDRGLGGTISDRVDELTSADAATPGGAARLGSISSSRGQYWREAADVFADRPLAGAGAGSFGLARLPHRENALVASHAHGFLAETLADTGLLGAAAALALLAAWLAAAIRTLGLVPRRRPRPEWTRERAALMALALCAVGFGLHSAIDWTWFVPGPAVAALVAAGYVAGRGPLPASGRPDRPPPASRLFPDRRPDPGRLTAAAAIAVTAGLCAWAAWQPESAARASDRAFSSIADGRLTQAARQADEARSIDPYSPEPLWAEAAVLAAQSRTAQAYRALEQAVLEHPRDPDAWLRLAGFELERLDLPARALETVEGALRADPYSYRAPLLAERARGLLAADAAALEAAP